MKIQQQSLHRNFHSSISKFTYLNISSSSLRSFSFRISSAKSSSFQSALNVSFWSGYTSLTLSKYSKSQTTTSGFFSSSIYCCWPNLSVIIPLFPDIILLNILDAWSTSSCIFFFDFLPFFDFFFVAKAIVVNYLLSSSFYNFSASISSKISFYSSKNRLCLTSFLIS